MKGQSRNPLAPFRGFDIVVKKATDDNNREDVLKIPPEVRFRERYIPLIPQAINTESDYQRRPDCNKANLARDGLSVQGPQALLTSYSRETALVVDHLYAMLRPQFPEYDINVDYNAISNAISMTPRVTNEEDDGGESPAIRPTPWENGPSANGSTEGFKKRMEECGEYMHHFAMHTPQYFISHKSNSTPAEDSDDEEEPYSHPGAQSLIADEAPESSNTRKKKFTTNKPKGATIAKQKGPARNAGDAKGKKRKVCEESEQGLHSRCGPLYALALTFFHFQGALLMRWRLESPRGKDCDLVRLFVEGMVQSSIMNIQHFR